MNKRGDMPTILLFVITLVLIVIALFSFASFNGRFASDSGGKREIISDTAFYEQYIVKQAGMIGKRAILDGGAEKESFQKIAKTKDFGISGTESFFRRIGSGDFDFKKEGEGYAFKMEDLGLTAFSGANSFKTNFGFEIHFDRKGEILREVKLNG